MNRKFHLGFVLWLLLAVPAFAGLKDGDCLDCHGDTTLFKTNPAGTNAGTGGFCFCMECHNSRNGSVTNMLAKYPLNQPNWAGGVSFGTHDSPQGDVLEGVNAVMITDGVQTGIIKPLPVKAGRGFVYSFRMVRDQFKPRTTPTQDNPVSCRKIKFDGAKKMDERLL